MKRRGFPGSARLSIVSTSTALVFALTGVLTGCQTLPPPAPVIVSKPVPVKPATPVQKPVGGAASTDGSASAATTEPAPVDNNADESESGAPWRNDYTQSQDMAPPSSPEDVFDAIVEPVPVQEPRGKYGNKSPYKVRGKKYYVLDTAEGYDEEGEASWYGTKFNGFRTSSGERYDMYKLTAAHTTLPIPTWVRVTNLGNGKSVIVRVNDRGPFHKGRIIDLSWAAANKLGYANIGTAHVRVEAITPDAVAADAQPPALQVTTPPTAIEAPDVPPEVAMASAAATASASTSSPATTAPGTSSAPGDTATTTAPPVPPSASPATLSPTPPPPEKPAPGFYIQLGAFSFPDGARKLADQARAATGERVQVIAGDDLLHRVRVGPYADRATADKVRGILGDAHLGSPTLVYVPDLPNP